MMIARLSRQRGSVQSLKRWIHDTPHYNNNRQSVSFDLRTIASSPNLGSHTLIQSRPHKTLILCPNSVIEDLVKRCESEIIISSVPKIGELYAKRVTLARQRDQLLSERKVLSERIAHLFRENRASEAGA